jgi:hypothetical protein
VQEELDGAGTHAEDQEMVCQGRTRSDNRRRVILPAEVAEIGVAVARRVHNIVDTGARLCSKAIFRH